MATMGMELHQILKTENLIQDYLTDFHGQMEVIVLIVFEFDAQRVGQMKKYIHAESAALSELQAAWAAGDQDRIIQRAKAIKPNFAKLFMLFGDFDSVRS